MIMFLPKIRSQPLFCKVDQLIRFGCGFDHITCVTEPTPPQKNTITKNVTAENLPVSHHGTPSAVSPLRHAHLTSESS